MTNTTYININADVGEGIGNEKELMPLLSSCNIACGGHAGNEITMQTIIKLAKQEQVKIGAHPSFPDPENFGRLPMEISNDSLFESLKQQVNTLLKLINAEGLTLHHIKPHGALYNLAAKDETIANIILRLFDTLPKTVKLYAPKKSVIAELAKSKSISVIYEAFLDRRYNDDLSLVNRQNPKALITEKTEILEQLLSIQKHQNVKTINDHIKPIYADTFCIHGDTKNAIDLLQFLVKNLSKHKLALFKL